MQASRVASDDLVASWADVTPGGREPLLVLDALTAFLDEHELGDGQLEVEPIGDGHSNVTYLVTRRDAEVILRRPPRGPLPPSAHDVLREVRVLEALRGRARVPRVLASCDNPSVIGAPFYLMEVVAGDVVTDRLPASLSTREARRRISEDLIDALVEIHAVDWRDAGLEGFGRQDGYLARQLRRFEGLWERGKSREVPAVDRVLTWLTENLPQSGPATIVHGDYRLGNAIVSDAAPEIAAILDWEMATLGDPLADLGYLCVMWSEPADPSLALDLSPVTREPGFLSRAEMVDRYEQRSGRSMSDIRWYQALALWKASIFMEGNYRRSVSGASDDEFNQSFGEGVVQLAARAEKVISGE